MQRPTGPAVYAAFVLDLLRESGEADVVDGRRAAEADVVERFLVECTPAIGAHTGPGLVGLAYFCDPRDADRTERLDR